jgi:hypothetical protein
MWNQETNEKLSLYLPIVAIGSNVWKKMREGLDFSFV